MSTSITVIRKCFHCKIEFEAKTTTTKYCTHLCASRAAKARIRQSKIEASNLETKRSQIEEKIASLDKEYFSVSEISNLLNVSNKTLYKFISNGKLQAVNLSVRLTRVTKVQVIELIENLMLSQPNSRVEKAYTDKPLSQLDENILTIGNCYSVSELCEMFNTNRGHIYSMMKRKNVPKIKHKKEVLFSKKEVDKIYKVKDKPKELGLEKVRKANAKFKSSLKREDCYAIEEIEALFNGKRSNLYPFLRRRNVPVLKIGNDVFHSRIVIDKIFKALKKEQANEGL